MKHQYVQKHLIQLINFNEILVDTSIESLDFQAIVILIVSMIEREAEAQTETAKMNMTIKIYLLMIDIIFIGIKD